MSGPWPDGALLVDGGRTGIRVAAIREAAMRTIAEGPGTPLLAARGGPAAVAAAVADVVRSGGIGPGEAPALVGGLTGVFESFELAPALTAALVDQLKLTSCTITSDVVTSHLGALGGGPGVVVAVGTGTVALALGADGRWAKTDGWGPLLGDAGSGYDVGRRGAVAALEHHDGRGGSAALAAAAAARYGPLADLTARVYAADNPTALLAAFAPDVAAAADAGDPVARAIWRTAAGAVVRAILGAADRVFPAGEAAEVSWAGSLLELEALLRLPVVAELRNIRADLTVVTPRGGSLDGAAALLEPRIRARTAALLHHVGPAPG